MTYKYSILIIEDNPVNTLLFKKVLSQCGYNILTADSGAIGLSAIEHYKPDLVLLDLHLPDLNGFEVLKKARETFDANALPILTITADDSSDTLIKAFELGANDYVIKPVYYQELIARVKTHIKIKSQQEDLINAKHTLELAIAGANEGIWDWDLVNNKIFYSSNWENILGYTMNELSDDPNNWLNKIHPDDYAKFDLAFKEHLNKHIPIFDVKYRLQHKNGQYLWAHTKGSALYDNNNQAIRISGTHIDINKSAITDPITGLGNELLFLDHVELALERASRRDQYLFAVIIFSIENYHLLMENIGHNDLQQVITLSAQRLKNLIRREDTLSHHSGQSELAYLMQHQFALLIEELKKYDIVLKIADKLVKELEKPFTIDGKEMFLTVHVGIAYYNQEYKDAMSLINDATSVLSHQKGDTKEKFSIFNSQIAKLTKKNFQLELDLHKAFTLNQFVIHYQPIINLQNYKLSSFEMLVRWNHPEEGLLYPNSFIELIENSGLMSLLTKWLIAEASRNLSSWKKQFNIHELDLHINISPSCFDNTLMEEIYRTEKEYNNLKQIKLELTEDLMIKAYTQVKSKFTTLKDLNIGLAIDDFGKGYSSLTYLQELAFDTLKIDKLFVDNLDSRFKKNFKIIETIINLAHTLGMDIIAEGIETETQAAILKDLGCEYGQGYLFAKPLDITATEAWLKKAY